MSSKYTHILGWLGLNRNIKTHDHYHTGSCDYEYLEDSGDEFYRCICSIHVKMPSPLTGPVYYYLNFELKQENTASLDFVFLDRKSVPIS